MLMDEKEKFYSLYPEIDYDSLFEKVKTDKDFVIAEHRKMCNAINVDGIINIRKYVAPMSSAAHTTHYITSSEIVNKHYDLCTSCFTVFVNNFMSNVKGEKE